eukprot:TRINITY_DN7455_c1_g1_i1.p1 TRINITY_DN7455_c1_g1~~TRINITY_DN7455_c1_g1_i1.p1  ORF type:complete len:727 (+),score=189.24 TRINITY_DN7455_c1_g1_i1:107-2287(+)
MEAAALRAHDDDAGPADRPAAAPVNLVPRFCSHLERHHVCDGCGKAPLVAGDWMRCTVCTDFDLCKGCSETTEHVHRGAASMISMTPETFGLRDGSLAVTLRDIPVAPLPVGSTLDRDYDRPQTRPHCPAPPMSITVAGRTVVPERAAHKRHPRCSDAAWCGAENPAVVPCGSTVRLLRSCVAGLSGAHRGAYVEAGDGTRTLAELSDLQPHADGEDARMCGAWYYGTNGILEIFPKEGPLGAANHVRWGHGQMFRTWAVPAAEWEGPLVTAKQAVSVGITPRAGFEEGHCALFGPDRGFMWLRLNSAGGVDELCMVCQSPTGQLVNSLFRIRPVRRTASEIAKRFGSGSYSLSSEQWRTVAQEVGLVPLNDQAFSALSRSIEGEEHLTVSGVEFLLSRVQEDHLLRIDGIVRRMSWGYPPGTYVHHGEFVYVVVRHASSTQLVISMEHEGEITVDSASVRRFAPSEPAAAQGVTPFPRPFSDGAPPASAAAVQSLPRHRVTPEDLAAAAMGAEGALELLCTVCQDSFEDGQEVARMPGCAHSFHSECVGTWLERRNTCPTCRLELPTDNERWERRRQGEEPEFVAELVVDACGAPPGGGLCAEQAATVQSKMQLPPPPESVDVSQGLTVAACAEWLRHWCETMPEGAVREHMLEEVEGRARMLRRRDAPHIHSHTLIDMTIFTTPWTCAKCGVAGSTGCQRWHCRHGCAGDFCGSCVAAAPEAAS